jgi:hypothetical protein
MMMTGKSNYRILSISSARARQKALSASLRVEWCRIPLRLPLDSHYKSHQNAIQRGESCLASLITGAPRDCQDSRNLGNNTRCSLGTSNNGAKSKKKVLLARERENSSPDTRSEALFSDAHTIPNRNKLTARRMIYHSAWLVWDVSSNPLAFANMTICFKLNKKKRSEGKNPFR